MRSARALDAKMAELKASQAGAAAECKRIGPRCQAWQERVDALMAETNGMEVRAADPRADSIERMAVLVGLDGPRTRQLVVAFDPAALPVWIELAAMLFLGSAFPHRRNRAQPAATVANDEATVDSCAPWTQAVALHDFRQLGNSAAQWQLAARWGVDKSTVSRWLRHWERDGLIQRRRYGREKAVLALPAPRP
jgi:hypothetical protein